MKRLPADYREKLQRRQQQQVQDKGKTGLGKQQALDFEKSPVPVREWKPRYMPEENAIDIMPFIISQPWFKNLREGPAGRPMGIDVGYPWYKLQVPLHYGVGPTNLTMLCLREAFGKECAQCNEMFDLFNKGTKEAKEQGKKLRASWRTYYCIYDYDDPDKGYQLWDISYYMFEATTSMDPQRANLLDAQNLDEGGVRPFFDAELGETIVAKFKKKKMGENEYAEVDSISFEPRDPYTWEEIEANVLPLDKMLVIPTVEQFSNAFYGVDEADPDEQHQPASQEETTGSGRTRGARSRGAQPPPKEDAPPSRGRGRQAAPPQEDAPPSRGRGRQAPAQQDEGEDEMACPAGGAFGHDCNSLPECDGNQPNSCDETTFQMCLEKHDYISSQQHENRVDSRNLRSEPQDEPDAPAPTRTRGSAQTAQNQPAAGRGRGRGTGQATQASDEAGSGGDTTTRRRRR